MTTTALPVRRLVEELDELHAHYAQAVNLALETGDDATAAELAAAYDNDAIRLVAEREGRLDQLPMLMRRTTPDTPLRRLVARFRKVAAATDAHTVWAFNPPAALDPRHRRS